MREMLRYLGIILIFTTLQLNAQVQKVNFSQYFNFPALQNPASVGNSADGYRIAGIFRQQWRSIDAEFQTFGVSGDMIVGKLGRGTLGAGFYVVNDHLGNNVIQYQEIGLSLAYHYPLDFQERHKLSVGISSNYNRTSIDFESLFFENQYSGFVLDLDRPNGETFDFQNTANINIGVGLNYRFIVNPELEFTLGGSLLELMAPKEDFLSNSLSTEMKNRWTGFAESRHRINSKLAIVPRIQVVSFQNSTEFRLGAVSEYLLNQDKQLQLNGGIFYLFKEAVILYGGLNYGKYSVNLSYDITASPLNNVANSSDQQLKKPNAFEVSFSLKGFNKAKGSKYSVPCRFF
jgi:type IX secretion system PorP/SprF family membrane protein